MANKKKIDQEIKQKLLDYEKALDTVFDLMDNLRIYEAWIAEERAKLLKANFRAKVIEAEISILEQIRTGEDDFL